MSKAEKYISNYTRNCSNKLDYVGTTCKVYHPWLTPDQARKVVEITRKETLQEVKEKLLIMLNTSIDNEHFFEQLDGYIEELEEAINYE